MKTTDYFPQPAAPKPMRELFTDTQAPVDDPAAIVGEMTPRGERARALLIISLLVEIKDLLAGKKAVAKKAPSAQA